MTLLTSFLTLALLVGGLALTCTPGQPPRFGNVYAGLIQRIDVAVFLAWQIAVARRIAGAVRAALPILKETLVVDTATPHATCQHQPSGSGPRSA